MSATVYALTAEVREAALDVKAVQRRIGAAGPRAYEWRPAEASARARMVALSRERGRDRAADLPGSRVAPDLDSPSGPAAHD